MVQSKWRVLLAFLFLVILLAPSVAFVPTHTAIPNAIIARQPSRPLVVGLLQESKNPLDPEEAKGPFDRFWNPKIDDPALPLSEVGIAQVIAPTTQLFWLVVFNNAPYPTWASPIGDALFPTRGSFLVPTLIHGAGLACCWLAGCLAAKGFEKDAFEGSLGQVFFATVKAGAFATGVLIFATQVDLFVELGGFVQLGESPETDRRILIAAGEVIKDIFFEGTVLLSWRLLRSQMNDEFFAKFK
jgi:hypothetical protein